MNALDDGEPNVYKKFWFVTAVPIVFGSLWFAVDHFFSSLNAKGIINKDDLYPLDGNKVGTAYEYATNLQVWEMMSLGSFLLFVMSLLIFPIWIGFHLFRRSSAGMEW